MNFSQFKAQFSIQLDPQQEVAVQTVDGPVLLLAVPGSGKTTVLVARLGYMRYVLGIPPEKMLTMTYTVSAAQDMRRRFASFFGAQEAKPLEFRTINGVCSRIIHLYAHTMGRTAFRLLEEGRQKNSLISAVYRSQCNEFATETTVKNLQTAITYVKNQMLKGDELSKIEVEGVSFPEFYQAYSRALRERQLMDYDDQMVYALQILQRYPRILQMVQERYTYYCVDEAQDTSKIQHTIIQLLAARSGNIFLVGDEDQSIYGFRAAYPQALTQFQLVYPHATVLYMEKNYRSTAQIVKAADRFIQKNQNRSPKHMRATREEDPEVCNLSVHDRQKQYRYLCKLAENCKTETAILYRDNDSALPLIDLLDRSGILYRCRQVESLFFTNRVVRDITDIIRFAQNPLDADLFMNIYYKLGAGISRANAQEAVIHAARNGGSILDSILQNPGVSSWTKKQCRALQTHMIRLLEEPADRAVYRIRRYMGYGEYLEERGGDQNKAVLLETLGAQEPTPEKLLQRLDELYSVVQSGSTSPDCPFVLSTIHSSKGQEYDHVILMDVVDGLLPKVRPTGIASPEELEAYEEERRLFYVGMTRAKRQLTIITFRKAGLESSFAREVFSGKRTEQSKEMEPRPTLNKKYSSGTRLIHRWFGPGTLLERNEDVAVISFDNGEIKKIAISIALESGQLCLEKSLH